MSTIVRLPEPPYFAVIAPAELGDDVEGFLGLETCAQPGFSLAVSYWTSLDAIDAWRHHPTHRAAKDRGRSAWFTGYATRIAQVIDQY